MLFRSIRLSVPFERLLDSQRRLVQNPVNKLLVLAGPGTGKTEVLRQLLGGEKRPTVPVILDDLH